MATELFNAGNTVADLINGNAGTDAIAINNGAVAFQIDGNDTFTTNRILVFPASEPLRAPLLPSTLNLMLMQ